MALKRFHEWKRKVPRSVRGKRHKPSGPARPRDPIRELRALTACLCWRVDKIMPPATAVFSGNHTADAFELGVQNLQHQTFLALPEWRHHQRVVDVVAERRHRLGKLGEDLLRVARREFVPVNCVHEDEVDARRKRVAFRRRYVGEDVLLAEHPMVMQFRWDEALRRRRQVECRKGPAVAVRLKRREKPPRAGPAQRADLEDAPRPELADHHVEHRRLDAAYLTTARPCRVLELTRRVELGAELGRVLVHEARVVLREARGRRRLHKIMVAGEKEAARPAGVNETQSCRRAEPEETHCCLPYGTVQDLDQLVRRIQGATRTSWIRFMFWAPCSQDEHRAECGRTATSRRVLPYAGSWPVDAVPR
jgi:hypothetical protein